MVSDDAGRGRTRRSLLALATGAATGLAGCSWGRRRREPTSTPTATGTDPSDDGTTPTETPPPTATATASPPSESPSPSESSSTPAVADEYGTVVDVVAAGADPTGSDPINPVLREHLGDDTLLYFPDGRYAVESRRFREFDHLGLVAARDATPVLVPSAPERELGPYFLTFSRVSDFLMEGFRLDFRRPGYGGRVQVLGAGDFTVRDVRSVGEYPDEVTAFRFDVRSSDATGLVERLVADTRQPNRQVTGVYVGRQHAGDLTFRDCHIEGFPDNGLYASAPGGAGGEIHGARDGAVHVEGGLYRNNNIANVRLGSTGSTAKGVTIVVDEEPPHAGVSLNVRGLRLRAQRNQLVEGCDIHFGPAAGDGFGALVFHPDTGPATIRDTRIRVDRDDLPAVNALRPTLGHATGPTFESLEILGTASGGDAVVLTGRDVTTFRRCCIKQSGTDRNGIRFVDSDGCLVADSTIDVGGRATLRQDSTVSFENVQYEGACFSSTRWLRAWVREVLGELS